jgi:transcription elongation factor GreA
MEKEAKYRMSAARLQELKDELDYLRTTRENEVAEQIKEARSFGDLSENSEYDEAKSEQAKLYVRIDELEDLISNAEIVEKSGTADKIGIGSTITVLDEELGEEEIYHIVGSQEADPMNGRISDASPLGKALFGCTVGARVEVDAPGGKLAFKVINIHN